MASRRDGAPSSFFFFQAEDGIRDLTVTGVQTCALPIWNEADRLVFGQLYESLIRLFCQGRPLPGLAKSWDQASGDRWAFTLRDNARFWDGAPVTARDVLASWRGRDPALAQSALIVDDHTLTVPGAGVPFQRFADQVLAVTKGAPGGGW